LLTDEWKNGNFSLFQNGYLARLSQDGLCEKKIDLKKVYNAIKIKPALDFLLKNNSSEKTSIRNLLINKDSKLMIIPNRTGTKWILLFIKNENLRYKYCLLIFEFFLKYIQI
jgi:hypothetical protein